MSIADVPWLPLALALIYLAAAACIYRILMTYRVAQGAIAWILALIGLPYVAVPMFLLFGRNRFGGYIRARRTGDAALTELLNHFEQQTAAVSKRNDEHVPDELQVLCKLGPLSDIILINFDKPSGPYLSIVLISPLFQKNKPIFFTGITKIKLYNSSKYHLFNKNLYIELFFNIKFFNIFSFLINK